jgi:drug/metabolite transporter (DMT)-like permease
VLLALLPGLFHYAAALTFTRALLQADAATVAGISQVSPLFGVIWGTLFLGEHFTPLNYAGIGLIVLCAVLLAWEKPLESPLELKLPRPPASRPRGQLSLALGLVLFGAFLRSLSDLFTKIAVTDLAFWDAFALSRLGMLLPALLLLLHPIVRGLVWQPVKAQGPKVLALIAGIELFALLNLILITAAYARGPLAFVSAAQSAVPVFILALTGMLNRLRPGAVVVKPNGLPPLAKIVLSGGLVCGVLLLTVRP